MPARVPLATPDEVAQYVRKTEKTLAQYRWRGVGPRYLKLENGAIRYRWADVEAWLERQASAPIGA